MNARGSIYKRDLDRGSGVVQEILLVDDNLRTAPCLAVLTIPKETVDQTILLLFPIVLRETLQRYPENIPYLTKDKIEKLIPVCDFCIRANLQQNMATIMDIVFPFLLDLVGIGEDLHEATTNGDFTRLLSAEPEVVEQKVKVKQTASFVERE